METHVLKNHSGVCFYGCSFTEGGGLDDLRYFKHVKDKDWFPKHYLPEIDKLDKNRSFLEKFAIENRFSSCLKKYVDTEIINYAVSANNNENILNQAFEGINQNPNHIHIIQWTFPERKLYFHESTKEFYRVHGVGENGTDGINIFPVNDKYAHHNLSIEDANYLKMHHLDRLMYFFNVTYEKDKLSMLDILLRSYGDQINARIYFLPWEVPHQVSDRHIMPTGVTMQEWAENNKKMIFHETDYQWVDSHLSYEGHNDIALHILERFKSDGLI